MPRHVDLTQEEFELWAIANNILVQRARPYTLAECHCGDLNCHGWRFVELFRTEPIGRPIAHGIAELLHA